MCAGAGGQAVGLEQAGFDHVGLVEIDPYACDILRLNRPAWNVLESDIRAIKGRDYRGVDLMAEGVPCPPLSIAGKKLGASDGRNLFPEVLRLAKECKPKAVLVENVPGLMEQTFDEYRAAITRALEKMGIAVPGRASSTRATSGFRSFGPARFWLLSSPSTRNDSGGPIHSRTRPRP